MNWKEQLKTFEEDNNWEGVMNLMEQTIESNPDDVDAYIYAIYSLHNILVEETYTEEERARLETLLKKYLESSFELFSENAEYLFFVGKILYIAEWYFGLREDQKPLQERTAFKMQKKAYELEPNNKLFEWAYRFTLHDPLAPTLAKELLTDQKKVEWLQSKGFAGEYILGSLEWSSNRTDK